MYPWQKMVYDQIIQDGLADCSLVIFNKESEASTKSKGLLKKILAPHFLFEQFKKRKLNTCIYRQLSQKVLPEIAAIEVGPEKKGKYAELFLEEDIEKIKSKNLDFIIRFGFGILKGEILNAARWGIWSFHHGDEQKFRGGPPGF